MFVKSIPFTSIIRSPGSKPTDSAVEFGSTSTKNRPTELRMDEFMSNLQTGLRCIISAVNGGLSWEISFLTKENLLEEMIQLYLYY